MPTVSLTTLLQHLEYAAKILKCGYVALLKLVEFGIGLINDNCTLCSIIKNCDSKRDPSLRII